MCKVSYYIKIVQNSKYLTDLLDGTNLFDAWNATCIAEQLQLLQKLLFVEILGERILCFKSKGGKGRRLKRPAKLSLFCYNCFVGNYSKRIKPIASIFFHIQLSAFGH